MTTMSIRGLDPKVLAALKRQAQAEGSSLNALVLRLLQGDPRHKSASAAQTFDDLDALAGTWSAKDSREFERATRPFSEVDPALWK